MESQNDGTPTIGYYETTLLGGHPKDVQDTRRSFSMTYSGGHNHKIGI